MKFNFIESIINNCCSFYQENDSNCMHLVCLKTLWDRLFLFILFPDLFDLHELITLLYFFYVVIDWQTIHVFVFFFVRKVVHVIIVRFKALNYSISLIYQFIMAHHYHRNSSLVNVAQERPGIILLFLLLSIWSGKDSISQNSKQRNWIVLNKGKSDYSISFLTI